MGKVFGKAFRILGSEERKGRSVDWNKYSQTHKDSSKSFPVVYKVDLQL